MKPEANMTGILTVNNNFIWKLLHKLLSSISPICRTDTRCISVNDIIKKNYFLRVKVKQGCPTKDKIEFRLMALLLSLLENPHKFTFQNHSK